MEDHTGNRCIHGDPEKVIKSHFLTKKKKKGHYAPCHAPLFSSYVWKECIYY